MSPKTNAPPGMHTRAGEESLALHAPAPQVPTLEVVLGESFGLASGSRVPFSDAHERIELGSMSRPLAANLDMVPAHAARRVTNTRRCAPLSNERRTKRSTVTSGLGSLVGVWSP